MIKTKKQAEDLIYRSYMKAAKHLKYELPDSEKRHPEYMRAVMRQLDKNNKNILVTGSKGKGAAAVMISAILRAHGENTGLLTSPHIIDFNERIRINDTYITDEELISACNKIQPTIELMDITIAESAYISPIGVQALIALLHFKGKTAHNVFECGKGVRYDDINNLSREYSVINRVLAEHTRELGGTIEKIADDKAEIIVKGQKCAYTAEQDTAVMDILEKRAKSCGVRLKKYGRDFFCRNVCMTGTGMQFDIVTEKTEYRDLILPLLGVHQAENAALAAAVCEDILGEINCVKLRAALANVRWAGRMEILSQSAPVIIADACINRASAERVREVTEQMPHKSITAVIGVPADKDYKGVAEVMSEIADKIIMTAADNPHYKFDKSQAKEIKNAVYIPKLDKAMKTAKSGGADMIVVLGTTALIAELYKKYEAIRALESEFKITSAGSGFTDMICPKENINAFIDAINGLGVRIEGFTWWCLVKQGQEPCGMGGPKNKFGEGWYSEVSMGDVKKFDSNEEVRNYLLNEYPESAEYKECYTPGFWLDIYL